MQAHLKYDRINAIVTDTTNPTFPRGDTVFLTGTVSGQDLTGLSASATLKMFVFGSNIPSTVATKSSVADGGITITDTSDYVKNILVGIAASADTAGVEPGTQFVFDVEFKTTGATPESVFSVKGRFKVSEDYTVN